jgi:hypothetical protein
MAPLEWSFGRPSDALGREAGRLFAIGDEELVIAYGEASQAVAIDLGPARDLIVMCKRS